MKHSIFQLTTKNNVVLSSITQKYQSFIRVSVVTPVKAVKPSEEVIMGVTALANSLSAIVSADFTANKLKNASGEERTVIMRQLCSYSSKSDEREFQQSICVNDVVLKDLEGLKIRILNNGQEEKLTRQQKSELKNLIADVLSESTIDIPLTAKDWYFNRLPNHNSGKDFAIAIFDENSVKRYCHDNRVPFTARLVHEHVEQMVKDIKTTGIKAKYISPSEKWNSRSVAMMCIKMEDDYNYFKILHEAPGVTLYTRKHFDKTISESRQIVEQFMKKNWVF